MVSTDVQERVGIGRDRLRAGRPWPGRVQSRRLAYRCELYMLVLMSPPRYSSGQAVRSTFWGQLCRLGRRRNEAWRFGLGECRRSRRSTRDSDCQHSRPWPRDPSRRRRSQLVARSVRRRAYMVKPDARSLAEGLVAGLDRGPDTTAMIARGRARAKTFTWEASAAAHAALWRSCVG